MYASCGVVDRSTVYYFAAILILARFCKRLRIPGIDSEKSIPPANVAWRSGTTNNRVIVPGRQTSQAGGIDSLESMGIDSHRFLGIDSHRFLGIDSWAPSTYKLGSG
jgi:hypothetical protein